MRIALKHSQQLVVTQKKEKRKKKKRKRSYQASDELNLCEVEDDCDLDPRENS